VGASHEVTVHYFGVMREITRAPQSTVVIEADRVTVRTICRELCRRYGDRMRFELYRSGSTLSLYVRVLIDGKEIGHQGGLDTEVPEGRRIEILSFTAFSGG